MNTNLWQIKNKHARTTTIHEAILYVLIIMPAGIRHGFVTVALRFMLTKNGFPVALTAGVVAVGGSANL